MQDTILKYIKVLGNYSFEELEFNEVDALILSLIPYVDLSDIKFKQSVAIKDVLNLTKKKFNLKRKDSFLDNTRNMLNILATKDRYKDLLLENYVKINNKQEQFGAITIRLDKHTIFVAFEGTEDNLVGWEEDFRMSHMYPIPAQKSAGIYLQEQAKLNNFHIYIGGHSKGGNLSMAAGLKANFLTRLRIKKIYNFDGPGFLDNQLKSRNFVKISKKICTYIPEESVVGVLLNNPTKTKVIKSYAKKTLAHDAFTWQCFGSIFCEGVLSDYSYNVQRKVRQIMSNYTNDDKKLFVDTFFKILYNSGYTEKSELNKVSFIKAKNIIKEMHKLSKEEKNILFDILKIFLKDDKHE